MQLRSGQIFMFGSNNKIVQEFSNWKIHSQLHSRIIVNWSILHQIQGYVGRISRIPSRSHLHLWQSQATCWSPLEWVCNDLLDGLTRTICQCLWSNPSDGSPPYYREGIFYAFTGWEASPDWGTCCTYWTPIACAVTTSHTKPNRRERPSCSDCGILGNLKEKCYRLHNYPSCNKKPVNNKSNTIVNNVIEDESSSGPTAVSN